MVFKLTDWLCCVHRFLQEILVIEIYGCVDHLFLIRLFFAVRPTSLNLNFSLNARLSHQQNSTKSRSKKVAKIYFKFWKKFYFLFLIFLKMFFVITQSAVGSKRKFIFVFFSISSVLQCLKKMEIVFWWKSF